MSSLIQNNNTFTLGDITASHEKLPVGNYSLQHSDMIGYFLVKQEDFKLPTKLYGDFKFIKRWIKSYKDNSEKNLGILLSGTKGTGKTVAAQLFCSMSGFPVIFITSDEHGPDFEAFISNPIFENSIIFIDEFEKVYNRREDDNSLLTLMDGMYRTKLIFLLTVNDPTQINNKLQNRLNRVKYHKLYEKLEDDVINEIIDDLLEKTEHRKSVDEFVKRFDFITMDVLTSIIKEVNTFDEDALTCASYLNLTEEPHFYQINVLFDGKEYKCDGHYFNYKVQPFELDYNDNVPDELKELIPEYSYILPSDFDYSVDRGTVTVNYSNKVKFILRRNSYSLAF